MYNDAKEEIRAKLAIEDVIGEYVQLRRSGRYWKGLSPFTNERTPSFFVTPDRDMWHDFSSNQGGDIFTFIMQVEGLDFRGALELLARKAGVDLSKYQSAGARSAAKRKEQIIEMNNLAINYYQRQLIGSPEALEYASQKRRLNRQTVYDWGIGYAPPRPELEKILRSKGYTKADMRQAGLAGHSGYELFRSRLMIPLRDRRGQVVGFTGRIIGPGEPKYLNTPDTILYHKSQQLFGLNFAAQAIRKTGYSVIVEGNLDVISSHQAGVQNVVGVAGTALTIEHLKSLARLSGDVRLCFDGDKAGVAATEKAIKLASSLDLRLSVVDLSTTDAKDPDELINIDPQLWLDCLDRVQPAVNWVRDYYARTVGVDTVDGQKVVANKVLAVIKELSDPVEQEGYLQELSAVVSISVESLRQRMGMLDGVDQTGVTSPRKTAKVTKTAPAVRGFQYLDHILAYLGSHLEARHQFANKLNTQRLDVTDRAVQQLLLATDDWGVSLIEYFTNNGAGDLDLSEEEFRSVVMKLSELDIICEQAGQSVGGVKSNDDLLDYWCHYEHGYYNQMAKKLMRQAVRAGDNQEQANKLMEKSRQASGLADLVDPSRNRRQQYAGLRQYWQQMGL